MKFKYENHSRMNCEMSLKNSLLVVTLGLLIFSSSAEAVVTITFSQVGSDVHGVITGTLNTGALSTETFRSSGSLGGANSLGVPTTNSSLGITGQFVRSFSNSGTINLSDLKSRPTEFLDGLIDNPFGYVGGGIFADANIVSGSIISPIGTFVWEERSLSDIGLGSLTTQTVWTANTGGDYIQFVKAVPEPSVVLLGIIGFLSVVARRSRLSDMNG